MRNLLLTGGASIILPFPPPANGQSLANGICIDAEGAVWVQTGDTRSHTGRADAPEGAVVRVRAGGAVLQRIEHDRAIFAAILGGPDRTTLFLLAAEWRGIEQVNEAVAARTGQVLVSQAPVPGAGWP